MCRLALFSKSGAKYMEEAYGLEKYLDLLEKSCGGNGNGLGLIENGKVSFIKKGLKYKNKEIAKKILSSQYDYAIYHTRVKSAGSIKDSNCHPYVSNKGDFLMCMNGTIGDLSKYSRASDLTDTEILFRLMNQNNEFNLKLLKDIPCRFLGVKDGRVYASNGGYDKLHYIQKEGVLIIGSEMPKELSSVENTMKNDLWLQGDELKPAPIYSNTNRTNNYNFQTSWSSVSKTNNKWINDVTSKEFSDAISRLNKEYPSLDSEIKLRILVETFGDVIMFDDCLGEINYVEDNITGADIFVVQSLEDDDFGGILDAV